jgi:hypothetical protein
MWSFSLVLHAMRKTRRHLESPEQPGPSPPLTPLVGGADKFSTNLSETIIFMAPTVIDPSAENQPHSAFRTRLRRKMQEASEADTTVDDDSQS